VRKFAGAALMRWGPELLCMLRKMLWGGGGE
jgi:hypothetical protein